MARKRTRTQFSANVSAAADGGAAVLALAVAAGARGDLAEAADARHAVLLALRLHLVREGRAVLVDARGKVAAAVADVLDGAVGVFLAARVDDVGVLFELDGA